MNLIKTDRHKTGDRIRLAVIWAATVGWVCLIGWGLVRLLS